MLDMLRSLGVLLAVVLPAVALWAVLGSNEPTPVPEVNPTGTLRAAETAAPFDVLAMRENPSGWRTTSASFTGPGEGEVAPSVLRFGYLTAAADSEGDSDAGADRVGSVGSIDSVDYIGYLQTNETRRTVLASVSAGSQPVGAVEAGGVTWSVYETTRGEQAWVRTEPDSLLVITGSAAEADFALLASRLS